jgi:hypothetical protein
MEIDQDLLIDFNDLSKKDKFIFTENLNIEFFQGIFQKDSKTLFHRIGESYKRRYREYMGKVLYYYNT